MFSILTNEAIWDDKNRQGDIILIKRIMPEAELIEVDIYHNGDYDSTNHNV